MPSRQATRHSAHQVGLTLVELLVTLAIIAVMLGVVFPGFQGIMARNSVATTANEMLLALNLARSQAVREGQITSVQAVDGSVDTNEWGAGWNVLDGGGNVIRVFDAISDNLTFDSPGDVATFQFNPDGMLEAALDNDGNPVAGSPQLINLCLPGDSGVRVSVTATGRSGTSSLDAVACPL